LPEQVVDRSNAIDIKIIDASGHAIPNRGTDNTHLYQLLVIAAFHANDRLFPAAPDNWHGVAILRPGPLMAHEI
jgi:hypothetical protein